MAHITFVCILSWFRAFQVTGGGTVRLAGPHSINIINDMIEKFKDVYAITGMFIFENYFVDLKKKIL